MVISVSLVLLFGVILFFALRASKIGGWQMIVAVLFGFFLAGSSLGPPVTRFLNNVVTTITGFKF